MRSSLRPAREQGEAVTFFDGTLDVFVASLCYGLGFITRRAPKSKESRCGSPTDNMYANDRCTAGSDPRCGGGNCSHHCAKHCGKRCE